MLLTVSKRFVGAAKGSNYSRREREKPPEGPRGIVKDMRIETDIFVLDVNYLQYGD